MKKLILTGGILTTAYLFFARPQMLKWGTRLGESQRRLPGDDIIPEVNFRATRAIDIDAPPAVVWPWLAQMGRDRTGWYALDALLNKGIPSATYIRSDLPPPQVGMKTDAGYEIFRLEPGRLLIFAGFAMPLGPGMLCDRTLTYLLERHKGGERTRLLARTRSYAYGLAGLVYTRLVVEGVEFWKVYRQLSNLRALAEAAPGAAMGSVDGRSA
ncbi:MAG: hypothetical protein JXB47_02450 [Anaerolineae bacterium]|nr:hypothetical protein [Anaerolineae bacterium]